jgi:hypothetical protein
MPRLGRIIRGVVTGSSGVGGASASVMSSSILVTVVALPTSLASVPGRGIVIVIASSILGTVRSGLASICLISGVLIPIVGHGYLKDFKNKRRCMGEKEICDCY